MKILHSLFLILCFITPHAHAQDVEKLANIFGKLPEISDVKISPDGTKLILMQNYQGRKILVTRSLTDSSLKPNGIPYPDGEFMWAKWISNDHILAGVRFEDKVDLAEGFIIHNVESMLTRLVSMRWDGEEAFNPVPIVKRRLQPQFQADVVDFLEDDPDHVLVQLDVDEINSRGVQKINVREKSNRFEKILRGRDIIRSWKSDQNHIVRFGRGSSSNYGQFKVRDVAFFRLSEDSDWFELYDVDLNKEDRPFNFIAFDDLPNVIYILKTAENGKTALFKYDVELRKTIEKVGGGDDYNINHVELNDNGQPVWYQYVGEKSGIVYLNDDDQQIYDLIRKSFPDKYVSIYTRTEDGNKVIFRVSSPTEPGTYYIFDVKEKKVEMLGFNYQGVNIDTLSEMQPISYKARDGLIIPGYLSLPKGRQDKKLPTIIYPHWGPKYRDSWRFDYITQFFTSLGYAVLQMNYRGSSGYGEEFMKRGEHQWGNKILDDINDGTKWMIEQGYTDPDNICIVGDTYGGYAALQAIVKDQSLYKCAVAHAAITDLSTYREDRRNFTNYRELMNYIESDDYTLDEASPANNIDKINVPVLLLHSEKDTRVKVRHSDGFYSKMMDAGKDIKYVKWKEGNNFLDGEVQRVDFLRQTGLFLKQNLN